MLVIFKVKRLTLVTAGPHALVYKLGSILGLLTAEC
jgi:hypothetical protein